MSIDLQGTWQLALDGREVACVLPGDIHSALLDHDLIPDPYFASNEDVVRWVMEREWVLHRVVELTAEQAALLNQIELDRVDTLATVRINGTKVGRCENAFRRWRFDVAPGVLSAGENRVELVFDNPVAAAKALNEVQDYAIPWHWNVDLPHANLIRMIACDSGWDWNICLTPLGVSGTMVLRQAPALSLDYLNLTQNHSEGAGSGSGEGRGQGGVELHFTVSGTLYDRAALDGLEGVLHVDGQALPLRPEPVDGGGFRAVASCTIEEPRLWWPNGMGEQALYPVEAWLDGQQLTRTIGLRTIEIDQSRDDTGTAMRFVVNGQPIFAKGANWIPVDALPARRTPENTRPLLKAAVEANMNMIRVWGGGLYEPDWFYDLCAEVGLLVWQDAMFSCHLYPSDQAFLANVRAELDHNIQRLQSAPAIALWCGDNEVIGALTWYLESRANRDRYLVGYDRLNRTVEAAVTAHDSSREFWPSSPCNGSLDFGDAWHDDASGDMHFWDVWHEAKPFSDYYRVRPRFCSEFGFQSFPSLATVRRFAPEEHWNVSSPSFDKHQRNEGGNARIMETLARYFRFPKDFESTLYLSQLAQGLAFKTAVEFWRANSPHCAGALYWQLNDCWPVTSWATLEYGGRWKLSHYMAKAFFAPILVTAVPDQHNPARFDVRVVSDQQDLADVRVAYRLFSIEGELVSAGWLDTSADVPRLTATSFGTFDMAAVNQKARGQSQVQGRLAELQAYQGAVPMGATNWIADAPAKAYDFPDPALSWSVNGDSVTLDAQRLALFVHLESDAQGHFDEGVFSLVPGEKRVVRFQGQSNFAQTLKIRSLRDSY
ncbi:MAG: glycoside hydrolase family 2 protein [Alphaproteobacteria bacterium TMED89]|nr:beta-mannosidase [Rhodospirillaceae bacterium]RPH19659.1 MAG: glycoside hydrolase family 2 protein [Alphaproteobacteria bacterium TMED89]